MPVAHLLLAVSLSQAPAQTVSMSGTFVPAQPTASGPFLFVLQLDSSAPLRGAKATVRPRPGFTAATPTLDVYIADCALTLAIGFLVLLALTKDGSAPGTAASHWQGAMISGFGLGLVTPQDLLGKVK